MTRHAVSVRRRIVPYRPYYELICVNAMSGRVTSYPYHIPTGKMCKTTVELTRESEKECRTTGIWVTPGSTVGSSADPKANNMVYAELKTLLDALHSALRAQPSV